MNDVMQKIMEFINNNTLILIGICVFLILVLIGYLIDNSVKSKRVRNDIKNAAQVPEKIKNEIIKEAKENETASKVEEIVAENKEMNDRIQDNKQDTPIIDSTNLNTSLASDSNTNENNNDINAPFDLGLTSNESSNNVNLNTDEDMNASLNLDSTFSNAQPFNVDFNNANKDNDMNTSLNLDSSLNNTETFNFDLNTDISSNNYVDPDASIMNIDSKNIEYSNDKKLSEILSNMNSFSAKKDEDYNIFSNNTNDVQKENDNSTDELDRIMRKLSSMNNNVQDDNYTNIF